MALRFKEKARPKRVWCAYSESIIS